MKLSEWHSDGGRWYVACVDDLTHNSGAWWYPARHLGIPLDEWVKLLIQYKAIVKFVDDSDFLLFYWNDYKDAHKFLLDMNRKLRLKN